MILVTGYPQRVGFGVLYMVFLFVYSIMNHITFVFKKYKENYF